MVGGIETLAVTDTGAPVSMMFQPLYQKIRQLSQIDLQTREIPWLEGVGGNPVPTLGHSKFEVGVDNAKYKTAG